MTIGTKLTVQFASIFAFILLLFSLVIYYFTFHYGQNDFYRRIAGRTQYLLY